MRLVDHLRQGLRNVKDTIGMDQADKLMKQAADRIEDLEKALREIMEESDGFAHQRARAALGEGK